MATFWATFGIILSIFIITSGHIAHEPSYLKYTYLSLSLRQISLIVFLATSAGSLTPKELSTVTTALSATSSVRANAKTR